ncbi:TPA: hypothetical protein ACUK8B_004204, partial [Escherichia coli]
MDCRTQRLKNRHSRWAET